MSFYCENCEERGEAAEAETERLRKEVERLQAEVARLTAERDEADHSRMINHAAATMALDQRDALLARVEAAEKAIERVLPAKAREHIDCWKVNYGLDRYDKVTAARRWAEAGGPSDGPIMALATAIEWLEST